jgi:hypothetical protein
MAVFVGSATQLLSILVWPLCIAAMGVIGASQILFTLEDCSGDDVCTLSDAYTVVYAMVLGEPVAADGYELSRGTIGIIIVFTVLWIWWILSAMAVTVTEAIHLDRKQLALRWYWEPKVMLTIMARSGDRTRGKIIETPSLVEQYCNRMEDAWDILTSAICGRQSNDNWNMWCLRSKMASILTGFLSVFILPLWFGLGLFTFGLLWPPQVRHWLFRPVDDDITQRGGSRPKHVGISTLSSYSQDDMTLVKLSQLRADVMDLKGDLGFLKDVIYRAVMDEDLSSRR